MTTEHTSDSLTITISGREGVGKTTIANEIMLLLSGLGYTVRYHSKEEFPHNDYATHRYCLGQALAESRSVTLVEEHGTSIANIPDQVFMISPAVSF